MVGKSSSSAGEKCSRERVYLENSGGSMCEAAAAETGSREVVNAWEQTLERGQRQNSGRRSGGIRAVSGKDLGTVLHEDRGTLALAVSMPQPPQPPQSGKA